MPGTSLGVGGSLSRRPVRAVIAAAFAILGVFVVATWVNDRNPAVSSSTFEQPVTVEAVIIEQGRTTQGGNVVCGPTYRLELDGQQVDVVAPVRRTPECAPEGTTQLVTVDAANPTSVVPTELERTRNTSAIAAVAVLAAVTLVVVGLIRWRARRVGGGGAAPRRSGRRG